MTSNKVSHPHRFLLAATMAAALVLSACGSTSQADTASTDTGDQTVASLPEAPAETGTDEAGSDGDVDSGADTTNDSSNDQGAAEDLSPEEAQLRFEQCLEDAGIENPFGDAEGESITGEDGGEQGTTFALELDDEADFEAFEKCNEIMGEAFGEFTPSPEQEALLKDAELEFNQCMTDKGFDISGEGGGFEIEGDIDFDELDAAASECDSAFDALNSALAEEGEDS